MGEISTIGIDIAKHVFQLHGVDGAGKLFCADGCGGARSRASLPLCRPVLLVLRHAALRTSGRARPPVAGMSASVMALCQRGASPRRSRSQAPQSKVTASPRGEGGEQPEVSRESVG